MGLTSGLPMVSPVLSRVKIHVSPWNTEAARRKSARATQSWRATHSFLEMIAASADHDHRSRHVASVKANPHHYLFLVKSKNRFAFANPPTSPLKGEPPRHTRVCCPRFTRVNAACSVMLGRTLPRVAKVTRSEATTIKRWNAIPFYIFS